MGAPLTDGAGVEVGLTVLTGVKRALGVVGAGLVVEIGIGVETAVITGDATAGVRLVEKLGVTVTVSILIFLLRITLVFLLSITS